MVAPDEHYFKDELSEIVVKSASSPMRFSSLGVLETRVGLLARADVVPRKDR
jgi:hypothetical protein